MKKLFYILVLSISVNNGYAEDLTSQSSYQNERRAFYESMGTRDLSNIDNEPVSKYANSGNGSRSEKKRKLRDGSGGGQQRGKNR